MIYDKDMKNLPCHSIYVAYQGYGIILMASFKLQLYKQFYEPLNVDNADGCLISSLPSPPVTSLRDFGAKK